MPASAPYAFTRIAGEGSGDVIIRVDGIDIIASQFQMTYGINAIPTASALIGLGRDARTGQDSNVYSIAQNLKQMAKVEILLTGRLKDWDTTGAQWPEGEHVLFIGYVSGITYRRTLGTVSLVVNFVSKLFDLSCSAVGSEDVVPGTPDDLLRPTLIEGAGGSIAGTAGGKFVEQLPDAAAVDFSEGLLKSIEFICEESNLQVGEEWCGVDPGPAGSLGPNDRALDCLRGSGKWQGVRNLSGLDKYVTQYPLNVAPKGYAFVSEWVGKHLHKQLAASSIWGCLLQPLLPSFGMAVFPISDAAYVGPWLPMAQTISRIIRPSEYVDFNFSMQSQRALYGVGVQSNFNFATVESRGQGKVCVGAAYVAPANEAGDGMWMFVSAPGWMDGWVQYDPAIGNAGGGGGGDPAVVQMLTKPSHDAIGVTTEAFTQEDSASRAGDYNPIMENYAKLIYAQNSLRGRSGTLITKLRFDIGVGTNVLVDVDNRLRGSVLTGLGNIDKLAQPLVGNVARVTISINAEQASANTVLQLTNLRTAAENQNPRFSMEKHPFFNDYLSDLPLVRTLDKDSY